MSNTLKINTDFTCESDKREFVSQCERNFEQQLVDAAKKIYTQRGNVFVTLSGPTCSGKTTTAIKLIHEINKTGRTVRHISIDDFYLNRDLLVSRAEKNNESTPDFESIKAIDLDYLSECMQGIFNEQTVRIPVYSFIGGTRMDYIPFSPKNEDIIIFEGIQAIYPEFTALFGDRKYTSVHISVATNLEYNGVVFPRGEIRFLRRLVRDYKFRAARPEFTYYLWKNVVANEEANIIPYEDDVDISINSIMPYGINMLKNPLQRTLYQMPTESEYYPAGREMLKKTADFQPIDESYLSKNSLYHEFLG